MWGSVVHYLLDRPALLASLSLAAIILGIAILLMARLPPPATDGQPTRSVGTAVVTIATTPSPVVSPDLAPSP